MQLESVQARGKWIATSLGHGWSIFDPRPEDVHLQDILVGLSRVSRYAGQIDILFENYSVAEHSSLMTRWMLKEGKFTCLEDAVAVLLHDASEAFYGDMVTPLKQEIPSFREIEDNAQAVIFSAFGLSWPELSLTKAEMKEVDIRIRADERLALIRDPAKSVGLKVAFDQSDAFTPLGVDVQGLGFHAAMRQFMETLSECCALLRARNDGFSEKLQEKVGEFEHSCVLDFSAETKKILDELGASEIYDTLDMTA